MVDSNCFKMNYFLVILQVIKDATNTNLLYFSFNKPHTSAIFPAPNTISCNHVLRQDVDLCDVHCCLGCLVYALGAHTSSVSVYVRNIKKCMGEY